MAKIANSWDAVKNIFQNKRVQSFLWRTGMMCLAVVIDQVLVFVTDYGLSTPTLVILGLILGEISKMVHNSLSGK